MWARVDVNGRGRRGATCGGDEHFCRMDPMDREEVSIDEMRVMHVEHVRQWWQIVYVLRTYEVARGPLKRKAFVIHRAKSFAADVISIRSDLIS